MHPLDDQAQACPMNPVSVIGDVSPFTRRHFPSEAMLTPSADLLRTAQAQSIGGRRGDAVLAFNG